MRTIVPGLHYKIDLFIEIPLALIVLLTGLFLLDPSRLHGIYLVKVVSGALAVILNLLCFIPVMQRKKAIEIEDSNKAKRNGALLQKIALLGLPAALVALSAGIYLLV